MTGCGEQVAATELARSRTDQLLCRPLHVLLACERFRFHGIGLENVDVGQYRISFKPGFVDQRATTVNPDETLYVNGKACASRCQGFDDADGDLIPQGSTDDKCSSLQQRDLL